MSGHATLPLSVEFSRSQSGQFFCSGVGVTGGWASTVESAFIVWCEAARKERANIEALAYGTLTGDETPRLVALHRLGL